MFVFLGFSRTNSNKTLQKASFGEVDLSLSNKKAKNASQSD